MKGPENWRGALTGGKRLDAGAAGWRLWRRRLKRVNYRRSDDFIRGGIGTAPSSKKASER
jgi:hypothetical protein